MANSVPRYPIPTFVFIFFFFFSPSLSDVPPSTPIIPPDTACRSTPDPDFCKSVLPPHGSDTIYSYTRFSLSQSLSNAYKLLDIINSWLARSPALPEPAVRALGDCKLLLGLNIDFLLSSGETIRPNSTLPNSLADQAHTYLSALLTNQDACLDGLQFTGSAGSIIKDLSAQLSNGTKLSSLSLALFTQAWVNPELRRRPLLQATFPDRIPRIMGRNHPHGGRKLLAHDHRGIVNSPDGSLPLRISRQIIKSDLFRSRTGRRRLLDSSSSGSIHVSGMVTVRQDGTGNFTSITAAIAAAPNNANVNQGFFVIHIAAGVYNEYVTVPKTKTYLMMIGEGMKQTIITGNRSAGNWGTFNSATFAVNAERFVAVDITFQNTAGAINGQAIAVRNAGDLSAFYRCSIEGYQDTLYAYSLRQFYRECDIYGTVDFIFGNAAAVFQNCNIYPRIPLTGQSDPITAQGRSDPNANTGYSIQGCNIQPASDIGSTKTYLGRPWKQYSRTVYMQSSMGGLIDPAGWTKWNGDYALDTLYYGEYKNTGPGSNTAGRVTWPGYKIISNSTVASEFTATNFISADDWLPETGVPYNGGLL